MNEKVSPELIIEAKEKVQNVVQEIKKEITGQEEVVRQVLICLFAGGHVLLEGMPGLAKTLLAKTVAGCLDLPFKRIQFTPDLLPADLIGTVVYNQKENRFEVRKGPVFTGVLLADEINRAPAKVQSALLQSMEERQVTIGENTYQLETPFLVMATENPIDQEGTYQLPEAQMDRFLMKINVGYPSLEEETAILTQHGSGIQRQSLVNVVLKKTDLLKISETCEKVYLDPKLQEYIVRVVRNTRPATTEISDIKPYIRHGASPRASLALLKVSRVRAMMEGRGFVLPDDIRYAAASVLRHRIILSFEALSEDISMESMLATVRESTPLP